MLLSDFKYKPDCPENVLDTALNWLETVVPAANANVAIFGRVNGKPEILQQRLGGVCHVVLGRYSGNSDCVALYVRGEEPRTGINLYRKWLEEESFASQFILARNDNGVVVSSDIPPELLQNIAIMIRHIREIPKQGDLFEHGVSLGYSGDLVYPIAMNSVPLCGSLSLEQVLNLSVRDQGGGHRAWHLFTLDSYQKFLRRDFGKEFERNARSGNFRMRAGITGGLRYCGYKGRYNPLKSSYATFLDDLLTEESFRTALAEYRRVNTKEEGYKPPNPFAPVISSRLYPQRPGDISYKEVFHFVFPYCQEKGILECQREQR